jgi:hypothetical protein
MMALQLVAGAVFLGSAYYLLQSFTTRARVVPTTHFDALSQPIDPTKYIDSTEPDFYDENEQRHYQKPTARPAGPLNKDEQRSWLDVQSALVEASRDYTHRRPGNELMGKDALYVPNYEHNQNWDPVNRDY